MNAQPILDYGTFLDRKLHYSDDAGFEPVWMPEFLFLFQRALVEWATRRGRCAIFADCGLGKTPMQLVWAENVARKTNKRVLIVTPLAVGHQTIREGEKFGIEVKRSLDGKPAGPLTVTNYERLHHFTASDYAGVVLDESSILKNFDGKRKAIVTEFARTLPYRLLCTATAAPNDYIELGTSSEALGELGHMDMLNRFFKNEQNTSDTKAKWKGQRGPGGGFPKWRFKHHAEREFWRWVCSWARALRRPSDLGFDDDGFVLPELTERETVIANTKPLPGELFVRAATGLHEQRKERHLTVTERCEEVARKVAEHDDCSIVWCQLNIEGDLLESLIPQAIQVKGQDTDEWKEATAEWFKGERCICNAPMFRAKLATWRRDLRATGNGTTKNIESNVSRSRLSTRVGTHKSDVNTCAGGQNRTETTLESTDAPPPDGGTNEIANDTRQMPPIGRRSKRTLSPGASGTQKHDGRGTFGTLVSPSRTMTPCLQGRAEDVLSAGTTNRETSERHDSTLTTVTRQESSGDSSALHATSDSENSRIVQSALSVPHCICGYRSGKRVLISKPVMFGYGLNLQHCAHMTFFPSHSYEQYYQAVRRCWRFGQTRPVVVDVVTTGGETDVLRNLKRKAEQADQMFVHLVTFMNESLRLQRTNTFTRQEEVPAWL